MASEHTPAALCDSPRLSASCPGTCCSLAYPQGPQLGVLITAPGSPPLGAHGLPSSLGGHPATAGLGAQWLVLPAPGAAAQQSSEDWFPPDRLSCHPAGRDPGGSLLASSEAAHTPLSGEMCNIAVVAAVALLREIRPLLPLRKAVGSLQSVFI